LLQSFALNALGVINGWLNRRAESEACFMQALDLARRGRDRKRECNTLNNLGLQYSNWGRLDEAQAVMEASLALRREILPFVFIGYDDLADVMLRKGEFERVRPLLDEGEARFERREQPRWTQNYLLFRVRLAFSLGQWPEVAARVSEMRDLAAQTGETSDLHLVLAIMGYGAIACNDEATLEFAWSGLDELAKSGGASIKAIAAILHAERTRRSGDPHLAAAILRESLPLVSTGVEDWIMTGWEDHFTPLHVRGLLVRALLDLGEIDEARAVALTALDKAYAIKAPPFVFGALMACARVAAAVGELDRAAETTALIASAPYAFAADRLQAQALLETLGADPDAPPETDWEQAAAEWLAATD
jgi:tetratricopeptide (TPR) repeat protein